MYAPSTYAVVEFINTDECEAVPAEWIQSAGGGPSVCWWLPHRGVRGSLLLGHSVYECLVYTVEQLTCLLHMPSLSSLTQMNVRLNGFILKEVHQFAAS